MKKLIYLLAIAASISMQSCKNNSESPAENQDSTAIAVDSTGSETTAAPILRE